MADPPPPTPPFQTPKLEQKSRSTSDNSANGEKKGAPSADFECNICLSPAERPVVTLCGHLYCWPCIYKWISCSKKGECPVCKASVSAENVIPIYGRGVSQEDPRRSLSRENSRKHIPDRPRGHRVESTASLSAPEETRAFGFPVASRQIGGAFQDEQEQLSRILLIVGSLVILFLLVF
ncbi:hypothetical protein AAMO2058_000783300 [Amorphochlora amoebiformis]